MSRETYALVLLGASPGVLTELLWWLVRVQDRRLRGVEIWTTGHPDPAVEAALREKVGRPWWRTGREALAQELPGTGGGWAALRRSLGDDADRLPDLSLRLHAPADLDGAPALARTRLVLFGDAEDPLTDIRTAADCRTVAAQLHDRVRQLRWALPEGVELVGSLAGGRKTMSAALQSAFALQARPRDRLVHVLLDSNIEVQLQELGGYFAPTPEMVERLKRPAEDHVIACEVPFPLVHHLARGTRLEAVLDDPERGYDEVWSVQREVVPRRPELRARLAAYVPDQPRKFRLSISLPGAERPLAAVDLDGGQAEAYCAIAEAGGWIHDDDWWAWLRARGVCWTGRLDPDSSNVRSATTSRLTLLRDQLKPLAALGLSEFCLEDGGKRRRRIPAADRVVVDYPPRGASTRK